MTFALDCCTREAISWVASPHGYSGDDVREVMLEAVEQRFGQELPVDTLYRSVVVNSSNGFAVDSAP